MFAAGGESGVEILDRMSKPIHKQPLTPIDKLIDKACGFDPLKASKRHWLVTLVCPKCKRSIRTISDKTDPRGTASVHFKCPECEPAGGFEDNPIYFNAAGQEIFNS